MLKILRSEADGLIVFALSGRFDEEGARELGRLLEGERAGARIALDLEEVRLVGREVVKFLATCESQGIAVKNCAPYLRNWLDTRSEGHEPRN